MNKWMAVSFFTPDQAYRNHARELVATLDTFGIPHDVRERQPEGDWMVNVKMKARFILEMLATHEDCDIVWIDADARVRQYPKLFDTLDADVAAHYRNGKELLAGTMFFRNGPVSRDLLAAWLEEMNNGEYDLFGDQRSLQALLKKNPGRWKVADLPAPYTLIFDSMRSLGPPVIEHLQASRKTYHRKRYSGFRKAFLKSATPLKVNARIGNGVPNFERDYPNALPASRLAGKLAGRPCVIFGNSSSLNRVDVEKLLEFPTVGCNRILRMFQPDYYIVVDRDPYRQDLHLINAFRGIRVLSSTIYNENAICRRVPVQPIPEFEFYHFRAMTSGTPTNGVAGVSSLPVVQDNWDGGVLSAANISFPMLQLAVMLGANPIGIAGVDLAWKSMADSHFFGAGARHGCFPFNARRVLRFFQAASELLRQRGVEVYNLSPEGVLDCFPRISAVEFHRRAERFADRDLLPCRQFVKPEPGRFDGPPVVMPGHRLQSRPAGRPRPHVAPGRPGGARRGVGPNQRKKADPAVVAGTPVVRERERIARLLFRFVEQKNSGHPPGAGGVPEQPQYGDIHGGGGAAPGVPGPEDGGHRPEIRPEGKSFFRRWKKRRVPSVRPEENGGVLPAGGEDGPRNGRFPGE
jgi:hypothetical protein